jgi:hypothetical protein
VPGGSSSRLCLLDIKEDGLSASIQVKPIQIEDGEFDAFVKDNDARAADLSTNVSLLAICITIPTLANPSFGTITTCERSHLRIGDQGTGRIGS